MQIKVHEHTDIIYRATCEPYAINIIIYKMGDTYYGRLEKERHVLRQSEGQDLRKVSSYLFEELIRLIVRSLFIDEATGKDSE